MFNTTYVKKVIRNFFRNFHLLGKFDLQENYFDRLHEIDQLRSAIICLYYKENPDEAKQYVDELEYLKNKRLFDMFPYCQVNTLETDCVTAKIDKRNNLPYVLHEGKKLFFPSYWSLKEVSEKYRYYIERENLVGGKFASKAPHQYQSDQFKIESGDVLLDIGCAEGLIALDSIDDVKKVYLYEADPLWLPALRATFAPYKDKVVIINKWVGDRDDQTSVTLNSSVQEGADEHYFVKMDIEGAEELVVRGNSDFFRGKKIKAACCTYHKYEHYENLNNIFENWGYSISSSDGYMLCFMDGVFQWPYFRKGIIRANNIVEQIKK